MTSIASSTSARIARVLDAGPDATCVLDGLAAVAAIETLVSEVAALGAGPAAAPAAEIWRGREAARATNVFGDVLTSVTAAAPRGVLAAATGLALAGRRAATFLAGPDLDAAHDLLAQAAGRRVPLVVHVVCRASVAHALAPGSGHEPYHAVADRGAGLLFATNVQDAVDLALVARRTAERALVPMIVAMDAEQTAFAPQDVRLPGARTVRDYLGAPAMHLEPPTDAQRVLHGDARRLVPRPYDFERPAASGLPQGPESWGLTVAGARPYAADDLPALLRESIEALRAAVGRAAAADLVLEHGRRGAETLIVAQGAAVETAITAARTLRKVGVIGLRALRPLPEERLVGALRGAKRVIVLERLDARLAGDGPLLREIRALIERARGRRGDGGLRERDVPALAGAAYGLGGLPLRIADLVALVEGGDAPAPALVGGRFVADDPRLPKRQAMADALRRSRPGLDALGLRGAAGPAPRTPECVTVAIVRPAHGPAATLAVAAASAGRTLLGGSVRSRAGNAAGDALETDTVTFAPADVTDPGDDAPIDVMLVADGAAGARTTPWSRLAPGADVLVTGPAERAHALDPVAARALRACDAQLHHVAGADAGDETAGPAALGGLLGLVLDRLGRARPAPAARRAALDAAGAGGDERAQSAFDAALDRVETIDLDPPSATTDDGLAAPTARAALADADRGVRDALALPRFWDQVGVPYAAGRTDDLVADPVLASGVVPARSAALRTAGTTDSLLTFDPERCRGDASAWTMCPDGTVAPFVLTPRALLDTGIALATARGVAAGPLRSVSGGLVRAMERLAGRAAGSVGPAGELLEQASAEVLAAATLPTDRRAAIETALAAVVAALGDLPLVRTDAFFDAAERAKAGTGALFTLLVDPDARGVPALTAAACRDECLAVARRDPREVEALRRLWALRPHLPEPPEAVLERAGTHPDVGALGAMMLRHAPGAAPAALGGAAGAGARLALRWTLAALEHVVGPQRAAQLERIEATRAALAERIRTRLAEALPVQDLDALGRGLDALGRRDVDLATLSGRVDAAVEAGHVDGMRLGRLIDAARGLADLSWHLARGSGGAGSAGAGLAAAADGAAAWAGAYPDNPFGQPIAFDATGEASALALGLVEGQVRRVLAGLRLQRWAQLELDGADGGLPAPLRFADLTPEERALCPPILLVGDGAALGARGLAQVLDLLGTGLPVKVLVLGRLTDDERPDLALLAVALRRAYVVQSSIGHPDHLAAGAAAAFAFDGPALLHVHAPCPAADGVPVDGLLERARAAVASRAHPLLRFDPTGGETIATCLDLGGNPETVPEAGTLPDAWAARAAAWPALRALAHAGAPAPVAAADENEESPDAEAIETEVERRLEGLRAAFEREATDRVAAGLMVLAGYGGDGDDADGGEGAPCS